MTGWPADPTERRRAFRAFVRENHPDRGGDPEVFAAGVASLRDRPVAGTTVAYRQRWWNPGVTAWINRRIQRRFHPRVH
ncbi:hypothetical protein [Fodinicola feengrottensis]|uniref:hypothetical protein n=1 Tax=Fodinicola feengrottensis TaxID=435914 RepID=UPI0013D86980|nr:hypothetical protein [Fodinicola feengrottensis]